MKEIANILYGSQNYGLSNSDSDKDYKVLLCPEFEDFYNYHKVDKQDLPNGYDHEHYSPMSVIQFHSLLMKGNPNCIEMLFSVETNSQNGGFLRYIMRMRELYHESYVALVWDNFYSAIKGMIINGISREGNTPKMVSRAYYLFKLTEYIRRHNFAIGSYTWRNDDATLAAKRIREEIDQHNLNMIGDNVIRLFNANSRDFSNAAKEYAANNLVDVSQSIATINKRMKNLVAIYLSEELRSREYI